MMGSDSFDHSFNSGSVDVARHWLSRKEWIPSRRVALAAVALTTPVYKMLTTPLLVTAVPLKHPAASGPPGVGASAIGACFQCTISTLVAWAQCMSPQYAPSELY